MNQLSILIARLGWPSTSVRWWTMQELAASLGVIDTQAQTEVMLLKLLSSRKLEAEVVEILCIFWIATKAFNYSPDTKLAESIPLPSPLSNLFLQSLGLQIQEDYSDLEQVSVHFEIPDDFKGIQGVDVPMKFQTHMSRLERISKLPFVRQMAFEWAKTKDVYPDAPYQGDPQHFTLSIRDKSICNLFARAALRTVSAYLRTLAVATQIWKMPTQFSVDAALMALPIHPTLALLKSQTPSWFPEGIEFDDNAQTLEMSVRTLLTRFEEAHPNDELVAFSSPLVMSVDESVELSLVRWSQDEGCIIQDSDLATYLKSYWELGVVLPSQAHEPLSTTTIVIPPIFDNLEFKDCKAWPLAAPIDFERIGYLQHDLYPSRLYLPTMPAFEEIAITPFEGKLQAESRGKLIAELYYWNAGWSPVVPRQFGGNCGTALISNGSIYREYEGADRVPILSFYLWQVRRLNRATSLDEFKETTISGVFFV